MELLSDIIQTTLTSFDFAFCIITNVLTYIIIKWLSESKLKLKVTTWRKRLVLVFVIILVSIVYCLFNVENKLIFNSAILSPVVWSWVFKPICNKFNLDYIKNDVEKL